MCFDQLQLSTFRSGRLAVSSSVLLFTRRNIYQVPGIDYYYLRTSTVHYHPPYLVLYCTTRPPEERDTTYITC